MHVVVEGRAEADVAVLKIAAEFVLDVSRYGPLPDFPPGEAALEVPSVRPRSAKSTAAEWQARQRFTKSGRACFLKKRGAGEESNGERGRQAGAKWAVDMHRSNGATGICPGASRERR
jgi:hypothetical protein